MVTTCITQYVRHFDKVPVSDQSNQTGMAGTIWDVPLEVCVSRLWSAWDHNTDKSHSGHSIRCFRRSKHLLPRRSSCSNPCILL